MTKMFQAIPAEAWYLACAVAAVGGISMMFASKSRSRMVIGFLLLIAAILVYAKGSSYYHEGHLTYEAP